MTYTLDELREHRRLWVEALRSGEYQQARGFLSVPGVGMCCLGVSCDVAIKNGLPIERREATIEPVDVPAYYGEADDGLTVEVFGNNGEADELVCPRSVAAWLGLAHIDGGWDDGESLANRNDAGDTFDEIADIIESEPEGMFV